MKIGSQEAEIALRPEKTNCDHHESILHNVILRQRTENFQKFY
jgi:hypothetical protein